jgi:hypothetical protein
MNGRSERTTDGSVTRKGSLDEISSTLARLFAALRRRTSHAFRVDLLFLWVTGLESAGGSGKVIEASFAWVDEGSDGLADVNAEQAMPLSGKGSE